MQSTEYKTTLRLITPMFRLLCVLYDQDIENLVILCAKESTYCLLVTSTHDKVMS